MFNEAYVDWVDSRHKDEVVIVLKNKNVNLDVDTLIRLFTYMKDLGFQCNYIFCQHPVNTNQFDTSDRIYTIQHAKDFNLNRFNKFLVSFRIDISQKDYFLGFFNLALYSSWSVISI